MKRISKVVVTLGSAFAGGALTLLILNAHPLGGMAWASPPQIQVDETPIRPAVKEATSLAPVVRKAAPSVVYIYTKKTVRAPRADPFMDPFFRRFFGDPSDGDSRFRRRPQEQQQTGLGSGVIVSEDGYILTNNHVVDGADAVEVILSNGKKEYDAEIIGTDPQTDVAVLKIDATGLPAIRVADSDKLEVGDLVLAIGNPFGVGQTVTRGIVSAMGKGLGMLDYEDFIQTDASINPGNSGGALVDAEGRLIGINTLILSRTGGNQGIGFAIPINLARTIMDRLLSDGKVLRGYLGVYIQPVTPELAEAFDLKGDAGALVGGVTDDTPAAKAGIKEGDVIVKIDGKEVEDSRHLRLIVAQKAPGTRVQLDLIRDGKPKALTVKLGQLPDDLASAAPGPLGDRDDEFLEGVIVSNLTEARRSQFGIPDQVVGALVVDIDPASSAFDAGLRQGDVILGVNRSQVDSSDDLMRLQRNQTGRRLLLRVWSQGGSRYIILDSGPGRNR